MKNFRNNIEKWFETLALVIYKNRYKTFVIMLLTVAALVSQIPKMTIDTSTEGMLHKTDEALVNYEKFRDQFGRDEMVIIAINSSNVFEIEFLKKLKNLHSELEENVPYIEDITSLINARNTRGEGNRLIVEDLLEKFPESSEDLKSIKKRVLDNPMYRNTLISEDGKFTAIVIETQNYSSNEDKSDVMEGFDDELKDAAKNSPGTVKKKYLSDRENSEVVNAVKNIAAKFKDKNFNIYVSGSPVITHYLKQWMMRDMRKFLVLAFLTIGLFLFVMFRRISGIMLPLIVVIFSLLSTLGIMAMAGVAIKMPTQILPSFLLAVGVGDSVHILAIFYYHYRKNGNKKEAIVYSLGHSGLAVAMTSITTAGGLLSFSTADIAPVADIGIYASIGVMAALVFTVVFVPAMLSILPIKHLTKKQKKTEGNRTDNFLASIGAFATGNTTLIFSVTLILVIVSIIGATRITFSHDILSWFPEKSSIRIATEKINDKMRGSISLEVVIDTRKENGLYDPTILKKLEHSAKYAESLKNGKIFVGKAWSLTTILKEINRALNENRSKHYSIPEDRKLIAQEFLLFENSGSDDLENFTDSQFSKARFMVKVPFEDAVAYSNFVGDVDNHFRKNYPDAKITVTGMMYLLFRTVTNSIISMAKSYTIALIIITFLMVFLIGRIRIGLLSMIPNITPIIIMLGVMGWFNLQMDLFTMLVGSIAIGLAVDDTIHFMHNFRKYYEESGDPYKAVSDTLHTSGRAMLTTSLVLSVGFLIFMFANMSNIYYFGLLTGFTIMVALVSDFLIAPALMVSVNKKIK